MRTEQEIQAALDEIEATVKKSDAQNTGKMLTLISQELALRWCLGTVEHLYQWKDAPR